MADPLANHDPVTLAELEATIRADIEAGISLEKICDSLIDVGWTATEAAAAVQRVDAARLAEIQQRYAAKRAALDRQHRVSAIPRAITGGLLFCGGLAVTVVSYFRAAPGGFYVITTGAIVFGAIRLFTAVDDLRRKP